MSISYMLRLADFQINGLVPKLKILSVNVNVKKASRAGGCIITFMFTGKILSSGTQLFNNYNICIMLIQEYS